MNILIEQLKILNEYQFVISKFSRKQTKVKLFLFIKNKLNFVDTNHIFVNNKPIDFYFNKSEINSIIGRLMLSSLYKNYLFTILIFIHGGGIINQKRVIGNVLENITIQNNNRNSINFKFYKRKITRKDYRKKERKKFGLKKARKASQYHKR